MISKSVAMATSLGCGPLVAEIAIRLGVHALHSAEEAGSPGTLCGTVDHLHPSEKQQ